MRPLPRPLPFAGFLLAASLTVAGCGREAPKPPEKGPVDVTVQTIQRQDVPVTAVYVAQTQSSQAVNIQARVSGWLDKRTYVEGSVVKNGQVLFQMDPKPFQAQLDAAQAALQRNQAALQVATQNLNRTKPLAAQNALSQKDLDDATGQYQQSAAAVEQAKAQVTQAQLDLSYTTIRSPVDGVSSYAVVADGTYLSPSNSQLTTVSVLTPMWVNFSVSENEMERIRNDVRAGQLRLPEGGRFVVQIEMVDGNLFPYTGAITFADPSYNPSTGTFLLRATVNNPAGVLRPNQYVRVRLNGASRPNAIVVPQRAVQQSAKGHFVWVVDANSKAELRPVVVGEWKGEGWIIAEGLDNGDKVVVDGGIRLAEGVPVKAAPYVPPPPAAATVGRNASASAAGATGGAGTPPAGAKGGAPGAGTAAAGMGPSRIGTPGTASAAPPGSGTATLPAPYPSATPSSVAVYFATGSAALDTGAQRTLRLAAAAFMGIGTRIVVTGYADRTGNHETNVALAKKRAQAVRDDLVELGVEARRIELVPPVDVTGAGTDDQARRVDVRVQQ